MQVAHLQRVLLTTRKPLGALRYTLHPTWSFVPPARVLGPLAIFAVRGTLHSGHRTLPEQLPYLPL